MGHRNGRGGVYLQLPLFVRIFLDHRQAEECGFIRAGALDMWDFI
ncbi:MAG: hypothetical protein RSC70_00085 [Hafnia sp.]